MLAGVKIAERAHFMRFFNKCAVSGLFLLFVFTISGCGVIASKFYEDEKKIFRVDETYLNEGASITHLRVEYSYLHPLTYLARQSDAGEAASMFLGLITMPIWVAIPMPPIQVFDTVSFDIISTSQIDFEKLRTALKESNYVFMNEKNSFRIDNPRTRGSFKFSDQDNSIQATIYPSIKANDNKEVKKVMAVVQTTLFVSMSPESEKIYNKHLR